MDINNKTIGFAFTGSFCTYKNAFNQLSKLMTNNCNIITIFSKTASSTDTRFGKADDFVKKAEEITFNKPILTIESAEPIGPQGLLDILIIYPCTGNTIAKLCNGITDSPVLMAAKAHLRNEKPLVIGISTNDALGVNMKNIGELLNMKNIYFIPFGQDDPYKKTKSLVAHPDLLINTIEMALEGKQLQPIIISPFK
mgnify:CR=1 FL=1